MKSSAAGKARSPLSKERVLRAAVTLADEGGIASLSMRKLGQQLGVEAMSLYNHVANKEDILDGIVDLVVSEIELPSLEVHWKAAMRARAVSAHEVLLRHPWAATLMESRTNLGPARLRYLDAVIGTLRAAGFGIGVAYQAFLTVDSYIYGFTMQEVSWPFEVDERSEMAEAMAPQVGVEDYPNLAEIMQFVMAAGAEGDAAEHTGAADYETEFDFGLNIILDGFERLLETRQG